ncbi:dienelactone hydrolase family protein [Kitasatospora sp. NPDC056783]|uniref:dienelactone hydrolase family protein n=1 Tax=Kitasatospora sp. NPDC056783 TaxID=3345943 RepID=UPI0036922310
MPVRGTLVDIPTADGTAAAYPAHPDDGRAHPGVILYMDGLGLRPQLERTAYRLASAGYTVLVPNAYYRSGRAPIVELPELIDLEQVGELFARIGPLLDTLTPEATTRDADAYPRGLAESPLAQDGPVALTGYCRGALPAPRTAAGHPDRIAVAAGFHGGGRATDRPDSPHLGADRITAELYVGHADQDPSLPSGRSACATTT